jgi:hypothetical protein
MTSYALLFSYVYKEMYGCLNGNSPPVNPDFFSDAFKINSIE